MSRIALLIASLLLAAGVACNNGDGGAPPDCTNPASQEGGAALSQSHTIGAAFSGTAGHAPAQGQYDHGVGGGGGKFVINKVTLPQQHGDDAMDLNGDGHVDNQLGNIVGALQAQNLSPQADEDQGVANGTWTELLHLHSRDSSYQTDACAITTVQKAQSSTPAFNGTDHFAIDSSGGSATLKGPINAGKFSSAAPPTTTQPVTMTVGLNLFGGPLKLTLNGAHIQYTYAAGQLMSGQINGSVKQDELSNELIPAIADDLNRKIQSDPNSDTSHQIEKIFDVGDGNGGSCVNTGISTGDSQGVKAGDGVIAVCEVATNSLIKNVLAPDVQIFDSAGNYKPNPANTTKDSLSVGFGFTAVPADF